MSLTISSGTRIGPGVILQGGTLTASNPYLPSTLFELDASTYTEGDWIDRTGNGHNGTIYGSASWYNEVGGCFIFDGDASKRIDVLGSDVLSGAPAQATFSVWANITSIFGNYQHVAGWRGGVNFWFLILDSGVTTEARFDNGVNRDINIDYSSYFNTWAQTTFVVDAANDRTKLYINGVEVGSASGISGNFGTYSNLFSLGRNTDGDFAMTGKIGGATAYNAALTDSEVLAEFNRTKGRYGL